MRPRVDGLGNCSGVGIGFLPVFSLGKGENLPETILVPSIDGMCEACLTPVTF